jgi:hypothetical protein
LRTNQAIVGVLFEHVRGPTSDARTREQTGEFIRRNPQPTQHRRGVKVNVGIDPSTGLHFLEHLVRRIFERARQHFAAFRDARQNVTALGETTAACLVAAFEE